VAFDGSKELWEALDRDRELLRNALRVLESMTPCGNDSAGVQSAKGYLTRGLQGLSETLGRQRAE